tara:strand:+ start:206 stop:451 length:246 start_codon:yes stop_codon:yes gene_type:complete
MESNRIIAEFMGVDTHYEAQSSNMFNQYHTSWDRLMPVSQKIEDYLSDNVESVGYFDECLSSNDLEVRYQAVVEFIKHQND